MTGLPALAYLNLCRLRNGLRQIAQKPGRLLYWVFFLFWMGFSVWTRMRRHGSYFPSLSDQFAAISAGALFVWFGIRTFLVAKSQALPISTSVAGAIFLERTFISERLLFFWLYLGSGARQFIAIAIAMAIVLVNIGHNPQALTLLNATGVLLLIQIAAIPIYLLAQKRLRISLMVATAAIALYGVAVAIVGIFEPSLVGGDARFFTRLWSGDPAFTITLYAAIAVSLGCALLVTDYFPELYARSSRAEALYERLRGRRRKVAASVSTASSQRSPFRGPLVEIWKQLAYLRRKNGSFVIAALVAAGPVAGALVAFFYRRDPESAALAITMVLVIVFILVVTSSLTIAQDISKPIWWMIDGSLFVRLCAWLIAGILPIIFVIVTASVTASLLLVEPQIAAIGSLFAIILPGAIRALVMLSYALSPAQTDQHGPGAVMRTMLIYISLGISAGLGTLAGFALNSTTAGIVVGIIVFGAIGALAVLLTSRRIAGRGVEIALAEGT